MTHHFKGTLSGEAPVGAGPEVAHMVNKVTIRGAAQAECTATKGAAFWTNIGSTNGSCEFRVPLGG